MYAAVNYAEQNKQSEECLWSAFWVKHKLNSVHELRSYKRDPYISTFMFDSFVCNP